MDNRTQRQRQKQRAERQRILATQRYIRIAAILLAIVLSIISLAQSCSLRRDIRDLAAQLREKKLVEAQEAILAAQTSPAPEVVQEPLSQGTQVTLSFVGDIMLGQDDSRDDGYLVQDYYDDMGPDYFFQNVRSIFEGDDLTTASLVGSLTTTNVRRSWDDAYKAEFGFTDVLTGSSIDAVTVANEHAYDYSDEGYVDTLANLNNAGIQHCGFDGVAAIGVTGILPATGVTVPAGSVTVGLLGVYQRSEADYETQALEGIAALQDKGADIIVALVSWYSENENIPDGRQVLTAHKLIDNGADLVVGIQPYVLQGVEIYHDKYIVYSIGSFMTADAEPESTDALIFQQTFTLIDGEVQGVADYELIPCSITSDSTRNNCCPMVLEGSEKDRVLNRIYDMSVELDGGISPPEEE